MSERVVSKVSDPAVKNYWEKEFAKFPERLLPEIISPVLNKIGSYLTNRPLLIYALRLLTRPKSNLDYLQ